MEVSPSMCRLDFLLFFLSSERAVLTCPAFCSVNVFYRLSQDQAASHADDPARTSHEQQQFERQIREFRIGSIGFADSSGILLASVLAVPTEVALCRAQIRRGKTLCADL